MGKHRVTKNPTRSRDDAQATRQLSNSSIQGGFRQLSEEKLFELLIGRIRKREENEAANVNIQRQMEAHNSQLVAENQDLRCQLETYYGRFQRAIADSKKYKSRIEDWKAKIRKFKGVVDELGHDYDALRDDSARTKERVASLQSEKCDLMGAIDEIKSQISQAEDSSERQRWQILDHEKSVAVLKQGLSDCQERERIVRAQLADQKKRSFNLELYIQGESKNHTRQLRMIRESQRTVVDELDSGLKKVAIDTTESQAALVSKMDMVSANCCSSISSLAEKIVTEAANTANFTEAAHGVVAE